MRANHRCPDVSHRIATTLTRPDLPRGPAANLNIRSRLRRTCCADKLLWSCLCPIVTHIPFPRAISTTAGQLLPNHLHGPILLFLLQRSLGLWYPWTSPSLWYLWTWPGLWYWQLWTLPGLWYLWTSSVLCQTYGPMPDLHQIYAQ